MNGPHPAGGFGPWVADLEHAEERAQLRLIGGITASFIGCQHPIIAILRRAEGDADAKAEALRMLNCLPSLTKRRIISVFGSVMWAHKRPTRRPASRGRRRSTGPAEPIGKFSDLVRKFETAS
jgi:hypothetical protein